MFVLETGSRNREDSNVNFISLRAGIDGISRNSATTGAFAVAHGVGADGEFVVGTVELDHAGDHDDATGKSDRLGCR
jgi:hypothetical protein